MKDETVPTLDEARRINEAIIEAHLESSPGAFEAVAFADDRMQEVLDLVEGASGARAKAATIMCGTAWAQPFAGANKRTAVALAKIMLNRSGLDFDCLGDSDTGDRLRRPLFEVQGLRSRLDPETVRKTRIYLWPRLKRRRGLAFEAAVRRVIRENAGLFDYMAREPPLPAALSAEEREAEEMAGECADDGALAERIMGAQSGRAPLLAPDMIRRLAGPRGPQRPAPPTSGTPRAGGA